MWCLFKLCIQEKGLIQLVIIVLVTNKSGQFKLDQSFQEAKLSLIPGNKCKKMFKKLGDVGFLPRRELCAAKKYIRYIDAYIYSRRREKPEASPRCPFCPKFRKLKRKQEDKDQEIKYGRTGDCKGDSGGPLWKWIGKKTPKATVPPHCLYLVRNTQETSHFY